MRYAAKRDIAEKPIVDALRKAGAQVEYLDSPVDLLIRFRSRLFLIEVKTPGARKKASQEAQRLFCDEWVVPIIRTPEEALRYIGAWDYE